MQKNISVIVFVIYLFLVSVLCAKEAHPVYLTLEPVFQNIPIPTGTQYTIDRQNTAQILQTASDEHINLFELLNYCYQYLSARNMRIEISGNTLQNLKTHFSYGGHPIESLIPIDKIVRIELGCSFSKDQKALDIYLKSAYSEYIDVATAVCESRYGFEKIESMLFSRSYGMYIKKWWIKKQVDKVHLYQPGYIAVYAKKFSRPKKWALGAIQVLLPTEKHTPDQISK